MQLLPCSSDFFEEILRNYTLTASHEGRVLVNLCDFETESLLPDAQKASAVIAVMGEKLGFKIEIRLNRIPLPEEKTRDWLGEIMGIPIVYAPLPV